MAEQSDDQMDEWFIKTKEEAMTLNKQTPHNFVEISRIPKKMDIGSLVSLIVRASRIVPKSANFCTRENNFGDREQAVLVEFQSEPDAFMAVNKLRSTPYGKSWNMKLVKNPKLAHPEVDMMSAWMH